LEIKIKTIMKEINDDPEWGCQQFGLMAQRIVAKSWGPISIFRRMRNASHGEGLKHTFSGHPLIRFWIWESLVPKTSKRVYYLAANPVSSGEVWNRLRGQGSKI